MEYIFVIQIHNDNIDNIVELEELLETILDDEDIDGHDIGSNQMNIFIATRNADRTYNTIIKNIDLNRYGDYSCAYRKVSDSKYVILKKCPNIEFKIL